MARIMQILLMWWRYIGTFVVTAAANIIAESIFGFSGAVRKHSRQSVVQRWSFSARDQTINAGTDRWLRGTFSVADRPGQRKWNS